MDRAQIYERMYMFQNKLLYRALCSSFGSRIFLLEYYSKTEMVMHHPLLSSYSSGTEILGLEIAKTKKIIILRWNMKFWKLLTQPNTAEALRLSQCEKRHRSFRKWNVWDLLPCTVLPGPDIVKTLILIGFYRNREFKSREQTLKGLVM